MYKLEYHINKLKKEGKYKEVYGLTKMLYENNEASDNISILYAQSLILAYDIEEANRILEKYYSKDVNILLSLLYTSFEKYDFDSALCYLEELKPLVPKNLFKKLIPFEIYLKEILGFNTDDICRTKSAFYLRNQIKKYNQEKALNFIIYKNKYNLFGFNDETNMTDIFFNSLNHVVSNDRGIQFNPFKLDINFFNKYYMNIDNYSLINPSYKYAEISTLPFSNHICMISPSNYDKTIKKLTLKK